VIIKKISQKRFGKRQNFTPKLEQKKTPKSFGKSYVIKEMVYIITKWCSARKQLKFWFQNFQF